MFVYKLFGGGCVRASLTYPLGVSPSARAFLKISVSEIHHATRSSHSSSQIPHLTPCGDSGPSTRVLGWGHISLRKWSAETGKCWGFPMCFEGGNPPWPRLRNTGGWQVRYFLSVKLRFQPLWSKSIQCTNVKPSRNVLHGTHAVFVRSIFMYRCSGHPAATCVGLILMFVLPHIS